MSVIVARTAGFCWGVRRAVDRVVTEIKKGDAPFRVYGPLVHNPQVIEALRDRGVATCHEPWDQKGGTLFLRTHGVTAGERKRLSLLDLKLKDLTCPRVGRALSIAASRASRGCDVLIFGDPGHHEVKAILSVAGSSGRVISSVDQVEKLPELEKPFLLSQTTQNTEDFQELIDVLSRRWPGLEFANTICDSTARRQRELRELMRRADAVVIVGGRNSANTGRLATIASRSGLPVFTVETHEELDPGALSGHRRVLLSAGASTPEWSIRKVRERLLEIQGQSHGGVWIRTIFRNLVFSGAHIPIIALFLALAQGVSLGGAGWGTAGLAAGFLLWSFTSFTAVLECRGVSMTSQKRQEFIRNNEGLMLGAGWFSLGVSLALGALLGTVWLVWTLAAILSCLLYALPLMRKNQFLDVIRSIPGSREVLFTLAWGGSGLRSACGDPGGAGLRPEAHGMAPFPGLPLFRQKPSHRPGGPPGRRPPGNGHPASASWRGQVQEDTPGLCFHRRLRAGGSHPGERSSGVRRYLRSGPGPSGLRLPLP